MLLSDIYVKIRPLYYTEENLWLKDTFFLANYFIISSPLMIIQNCLQCIAHNRSIICTIRVGLFAWILFAVEFIEAWSHIVFFQTYLVLMYKFTWPQLFLCFFMIQWHLIDPEPIKSIHLGTFFILDTIMIYVIMRITFLKRPSINRHIRHVIFLSKHFKK